MRDSNQRSEYATVRCCKSKWRSSLVLTGLGLRRIRSRSLRPPGPGAANASFSSHYILSLYLLFISKVTHLVFLVGYIFFSFTLRCYSLYFSALFSSSVILCVVSDFSDFCHLYGLSFDRDPYEVVAEQMIDDCGRKRSRLNVLRLLPHAFRFGDVPAISSRERGECCLGTNLTDCKRFRQSDQVKRNCRFSLGR